METANRRLMWHGMFLFLLGLITGFLEQHFTNVRMGLAAHLEGVMNGIFLLVLGATWPQIQLPRAAKGSAYWTALYGTYVNWLFTTLAAVFWHRGAISHHGCRAHRKTVAGRSGDGRFFECRPCDRCLLSASPLGLAG